MRYLAGGSVIFVALLFGVVQQERVMTLEREISSFEETLEGKEQTLKELEKTSEELSGKLTESYKRISELEDERELILKENEELKERLDSMIQLEATAYTSECVGCTGLTYFKGYDVRNTEFFEGMRVVAVDPNIIELGTIMTVHTPEGSFEAIAMDIGSDIQGHRLDILVSDKPRAFDFGRQLVTVELGKRWEF